MVKEKAKGDKNERLEYFENLLKKLHITEEGRKTYIEYLLNQKRSNKFLNQKRDIEVLREMLEGEKRCRNESENRDKGTRFGRWETLR